MSIDSSIQHYSISIHQTIKEISFALSLDYAYANSLTNSDSLDPAYDSENRGEYRCRLRGDDALDMCLVKCDRNNREHFYIDEFISHTNRLLL